MKYILLLLALFSLQLFAQNYQLLTSEERAYLFHIVKKSPILDENLGRFFEYKGPDVRLSNGNINYDSIEEYMINNPEYLIIREDEIAKSPKGLLAEAANKMAIWELNKALKAEQKDEDNHYYLQYQRFEKLWISHLPTSAFRQRNTGREVHPKMYNLLDPSLSLNEKKAMLESFRFLDITDAQNALLAMNYATNAYVKDRTLEIYQSLGGQVENFNNVLLAAGDGSTTSGILEEREKDERGRWNKGLPKAVGFFPYQTTIEEVPVNKKRTEQVIEPKRITTNYFMTSGGNKMTNIHLDVWGYNAKKQTTVVIEKNGRAYRLFGSGDTRFLSPDSNFSDGETFQGTINELEHKIIADLNEKIYGRKGFDHWIAYNQKKKDQTELKIQKEEKRYSDFGYTPIRTNSKPSRQVKKHKKKSTTLTDYQPTTKSRKNERAAVQQEIIHLNGLYDAYKKKIADLEIQKAEAMVLLAKYEKLLEEYKLAFGMYPQTYKEKDGLYIFQDSTTFDIRTQEFVFQASPDTVPFEIRLLAIPNSPLSKNADEVMLHINVMDAAPNYNARLQIKATDLFDSDQFQLKDSLLTEKDSLAVRLFLEGLLDKSVGFSVIARGNGVGTWENERTVKDPQQTELKTYPGKTPEEKMQNKLSDEFARLRLSEVYVQLGRDIVLEVNSFTDPVVSNLSVSDEELLAEMTKNGWTKNQLLSALRTEALLRQLKSELNVLAGRYFSRSEAKIIIDRLNKELGKTRISVGTQSLKVKI